MYIFIFLFTFCIQVEPFDIDNNLADKPAACKYFKRTAKPLEDDVLKKSTDIGEKVNKKNEEKHNSCCENCGLMRFGIVQKIIYSNANDAEDVSFSSACVRCGLCLAIADKVTVLFNIIHTHIHIQPIILLFN